MTAIDHETLVAMLNRLKLTAIRDQLDTLLDEAARSKMTLREALGFFVQREIARRDERRISIAGKIAQFPVHRENCPLDSFLIRLTARTRRLRVRRAALPRSGPDPRTGDLPMDRARRHDLAVGTPRRRQISPGREPGARGDPAELFRAVRHRRHAGGHAGQGSWRRTARQAADAVEPADAADHRRLLIVPGLPGRNSPVGCFE